MSILVEDVHVHASELPIARVRSLMCDRCERVVGGAVLTADALRGVAVADGWVALPNGDDLCPSCAARMDLRHFAMMLGS